MFAAFRKSALPILLVLALGPSLPAAGQCISLTTLGSAYTQNFDTLSNTAGSTTNNLTISGWFMTESGGGARDNEQYAVDTGASTTGDTYSYGAAASTERALGQLRSGTLIPLFGACFTNNTGSTIGSLAIAYNGEEWRLGTAGRTDQMNFEYSLNATDLVTGTWTNVAALNFVTPDTATTGAKNGNAAADRTALSSTISSLSIANGATFWIRWNDTDATGADDGLAVDDFSLTPNGTVTLPNLTIDDVSLNEGNAGTTTFTFTVSLSAPAGAGGVTFDIATADNTATQPGDYTQKSLTSQTIPAGSSTYSFSVLVNGDTTAEGNETFFVNVTNVTGANATDGQGQGTIVNDDATLPNLTINDVSLVEGNAGTTAFTFTVSLSLPAPAGGVTFDIATANGTATAGSDYVANTLTGQTIPAGSSTYTFDVLVSGDTTPEPNETFLVNVTNVTNALVTDGQGVGTIQNDDFTAIHDIQGPGASSPLVGQSVITRGVVTGLKSNGFFLQEPDATADADPATSEGVFVFTSAAPPAAAVLGNYVMVAGTVSEYVPSADPLSPPTTEIVSPTVTFLSSGVVPMPAPVPLSPTFPDPAGAFDQLERLEGMRVSVASLTVTAPTQGTLSEANATSTSNGVFYGVVTGVPRPFLEPGIPVPDDPTVAPGTIPPIPRYDSNPERLRIDSGGQQAGVKIDVGTGAVLTAVVGALDYVYRCYSIVLDPPPAAQPVVTGGPTPTAVSTATGSEFTVATYNMERFFDTANDPAKSDTVLTAAAFELRLTKASLAIRHFLKNPDILGIEEMENLTTLQTLAARISSDALAASEPDPQYAAYLVEGNDIGGIDVAFLVKTAPVAPSTPRISVTEVVQHLAGTLFTNPSSSTELLNDRPPLRMTGTVNHSNGASVPVTVIVNHLKAIGSVNDPTTGSNGWPTVGARERAKRQKQAEDLAGLVQARQVANSAERIVLVGDFNAYEFNDGYGDIINTIAGTPPPDNQTVVPGDGAVLVTPPLVNLVNTPPASERYSYTFDGNAQNLDHILVNATLVSGTTARRIEHARIDADFPDILRGSAATPSRLSDHDPVVAFFTVAAFAVADLSVANVDSPDPVAPGQDVTHSITVTNAGPDPAVTVVLSETLPAGTTFVSLSSPGGWSCTTPAVGSGGAVSCSIAQMAAGPAVFSLVFTAGAALAPGTVLSGTATVTSTTYDPTANGTATASTTVLSPASVAGTKSVSGQFYPAGKVTYTITLTNSSATAQFDNPGDEFTDVLPASLYLVSASASSGTAVADVPSRTVRWNGSIPALGSVTILVNAVISPSLLPGVTVSNQGTISYDADGNGTNEASAPTDDPSKPGATDSTDILLAAAPEISIPALDLAGLLAFALAVAAAGALVLKARAGA